MGQIFFNFFFFFENDQVFDLCRAVPVKYGTKYQMPMFHQKIDGQNSYCSKISFLAFENGITIIIIISFSFLTLLLGQFRSIQRKIKPLEKNSGYTPEVNESIIK